MDFFNEILLKVGDQKYIYIFEMKFEKKNILFKNGGQNKICDIAHDNWIQKIIVVLVVVFMPQKILLIYFVCFVNSLSNTSCEVTMHACQTCGKRTLQRTC